ncbi:zinc transporter ZupT [Campylobacter cuniculorum]|uniref:Zinc transporter ZupT n=2 Tax=Campylobacter cuniculorum TaxID=374106 RepID=A0A1W6BZA7_9BACT|nr:zinc transporter ZupT [Campylobacter cuniculorum]ARJ57426.1 zinc transporter [Campylobacter cuniculorum DSM 23162 = LMG 24588]QOR04863.1 zinc transporter ZupT [Campylobacter cuniculorum]
MPIDFEQFSVAMILTLFAGFSTSIGAVIAFFSKKDNLRMLSIGLGFSAGVMIYISFMEILPTAFKDFRKYHEFGEFLALICFFGGILLSLMIDRFIPEDVNPHEPKQDYTELKICPLPKNPKKTPKFHPGEPLKKINIHSLKRTGLFTALAIAIHNFPEGFATFMASIDNISLGIVIAIAVAIHNIPEGLAVSLPIYHATGDKKKAFIYSALSGFAEPLGALVGVLVILPFMSELTLAISFAVVAGIMVFISLDELLPAAKAYGNAHDSLYGLIGGMFVMALSLILLNEF